MADLNSLKKTLVVAEKYTKVVQDMYEDCERVVRCAGKISCVFMSDHFCPGPFHNFPKERKKNVTTCHRSSSEDRYYSTLVSPVAESN